MRFPRSSRPLGRGECHETDIEQLTLLMEGMWLIIEKVRSEEKLKHYREHLEEVVEERTAELSTLNKELEAFSYSVSHDLRAPLRIIDGFSQILVEDYDRSLDGEGQHYLTQIRAGVKNMEGIIEDLLVLSRVSRTDVTQTEVDLSGLAHKIGNSLMMQYPARQIFFEVEPGLVVTGDENMLKIALENLINNAWKYTGKRDIARIKMAVQKREGGDIFFIQDNGSGFDMADVGKLFQPFVRLHAKSEFPGIGIGLTIVKRIIERHNGQIWAEGKVDGGATFYFTLG